MTKVLRYVLLLMAFTSASLAGQTFSNLEAKTDWQGCGNCGNTGATGATAVSGVEQLTTTTMRFFIAPDPANPTAFQNAYLYRQLGKLNDVAHVEYEFEFFVSKADEGKPQAFEFETQQQIAGLVWNCAFQFRYSDKSIRSFNFANGSSQNGGVAIGEAWENVGTFVPFTGDTWHHAKLVFDRKPNLDGVCMLADLDGAAGPVVTRRPWRATDALLSKFGDKLNHALQLDMNPSRGGYSFLFRNVSVVSR